MTAKRKTNKQTKTTANITHTMTIVLPDDLYTALVERAKAESRPKAQMARVILQRELMSKK